MTAPARPDTAKIFQFPKRPHPAGKAPSAEGRRQVPVATTSGHGAWYHEAAVQEDGRGRKS